MHIVFFIRRMNDYRAFSTLVNKGLEKGHTVECWHLCDPANKQGGKGYLYPDPANSPFAGKQRRGVSVVAFDSMEKMSEAACSTPGITHIVTLCPPEMIIREQDLERFGGYWCIIMHGPDSFKETGRLVGRTIDPGVKRIFFPYTRHFFDWGIEFSEKFLPVAKTYFSETNTLVIPVGCTMFDERLDAIDPEEVRRKYGIPEGKNIVLYLPYAFGKSKKNRKSRSWQHAFSGIHVQRVARRAFNDGGYRPLSFTERFSKYISELSRILPDRQARTTLFRGWHEPAVIDALRVFCNANDLVLVVKPRRKFDFSEAVHRKADIIIDDDESRQYPSKLQELFSVASLTVALFSTAAIESVHQHVPMLNIESMDDRFLGTEQRHWHPNHEGSFYSFPGVVRNFTIHEFIRRMPAASIRDFAMEPGKRREYMDRFIGDEKPCAAEKFYCELERIMREQAKNG
ncbi:hypothetical protein CHL67_01955 [Prosthecochloris sp. GSB1]|uniref:hypothetical protein n=1 Tax=Prosthecochloris sp. GSB1 TaxID=281093 RepID=UPI000B8C9332|nr:hypothetical protein [Prosthecochloris sp. GSB1]ASQ89847.1 hypothetical protein CHL67_01955 [Prosthecochloris sp. GSB1]